MGKRFWLAFVVTFVLLWILSMILHERILSSSYEPFAGKGFLDDVRRQQRWFWIPIGFLFLAFIWSYLFNRFVSAKSVSSGIHFGVGLMLLTYLPSSFINYATLNLSGYFYLWWLIGGIIYGIIIGAVMGAIMKGGARPAQSPAEPQPQPAETGES